MELLSREAISEVAREVAREVRGLLVEEPLDKEKAAKYLNITVRTMERRIKNGVLPARLIHRMDGSVYFLPSELHQFIKAS